jgi:hypothetical protein
MLLFLDFDGVLNSRRFLLDHPVERARHDGRQLVFDPAAIRRLDGMLEGRPILVVISSDWRKAYDHDILGMRMREAGFAHADRIVGQTPDFGQAPRGREIASYMAARRLRCPFAILDDRSDMAPHQGRLVMTDPYYGLTARDASRALALLTGCITSSVGTRSAPGWRA